MSVRFKVDRTIVPRLVFLDIAVEPVIVCTPCAVSTCFFWHAIINLKAGDTL